MTADDRTERLRAAGAAMYELLDEMYRCGLRRRDVIDALNAWDDAQKPPSGTSDREATP